MISLYTENDERYLEKNEEGEWILNIPPKPYKEYLIKKSEADIPNPTLDGPDVEDLVIRTPVGGIVVCNAELFDRIDAWRESVGLTDPEVDGEEEE